MTTNELMRFRHAVPFKPFELRLKDGRRFVVREPIHIGRNETGSTIVVAAPDDTFAFFPPNDVSEVTLAQDARKRRNR
ncbi:MAG TPA: hypothetical protein VGR35_13345 [Tepidisphaeraceae bacterium]|nr:hypothetical protein [Tepidisphaeraceae bacterium]